jgi:hypothetical protein
MSRSLNPQLLGTIDTPLVKVEGTTLQQNKKVRDIEVQIEMVNQKLDRWAQAIEQKFQQMSAAQKALSEQIKQVAEHSAKQNAAMHTKLNERRVADAKTQELFDRHNTLVNTFEARINHIQRVANEQEMKVMGYQSTYDEVLREIRNLKNR